MSIEYLRPGSASWWSLIVAVARRMGLGHAAAGTWVVLLLAALMAVASAVACRLLIKPTSSELRGIPRVALACAVVASLNATCWSLLTPPFQSPDEPDHYAYVQQLAETQSLPSSGMEGYSSQELRTLQALHYSEVRQFPNVRTISSRAEQRQLDHDIALRLSQTDNHGRAGVAASEPPLYYGLEAIPYRLGANVLDRLELMRLLSALFGGATALFVVLFLREALPEAPWAWTVGGLGVALTPLLGFISGAVNPDALLIAVSSALFYCLARGFRRGLTTRLALATGAVLATGLLTKLNFIGLVPGTALGLLVLAARAARTDRPRALRSLLLALTVGGAPVCVYAVANVLAHKPTLGLASSAAQQAGRSVFAEFSYIWQFYLPRLPGMNNDFPGILTTRDVWFDRLVGIYGWLDTVFPSWVYGLALIPAGLIVVLFARALIVCRTALRRRLVEPLVYAAMSAGVLALVGADSYVHSPQGALYAEPRYLLPMSALLGGGLAIAARGGGRRWVGAAGALLVTLMLGHDVFSQLQVISRYYG